MPRLNLSVKLTGLDPHFDAIDPPRAIAAVGARLRPLLRHARQVGAFVNVDMESSKHHDLTIELFQQILMEPEFRDWENVGIVLQAYLKRGEDALASLLRWGRERGARFAIRLVKGAYWDAETAAAVRNHSEPPVWTQKWQSDACYERMARTMLASTPFIRPAFASHNVRSLAVVCALAEQLGVSPRSYEVQMLFGMGDPLKHAMAKLGRCVRVYCPYGELMPGMGYLIRRLLENTSNEGFLKQSFGDRAARDRLLANPADLRTPSAPLPSRNYRNTDPEEPMSSFTNASNTNFTSAENRRKMQGAISYVRGELGREYPLLINGQSVTTRDWFSSHNPSNPAESIGKVATATTTDADVAVAAASKAFRLWRTTKAKERASLLRKLADRLEMRRFELAATMILEVGKPWREADADVSEAIDHCRFYAEQIERIEARPRLRNLPGESNMLTYSPKGVCAVIPPWAFPLAIVTGMATAPVAAGNAVVIKPARQASVVAAKLVETMHDVGFPPGVVNYLPGAGDVVGRHLIEHGGVHIVAFTGSEAVGTQVIQSGARVRPGQPFIKKMIVEMGGKNAIIVDDDADVDGAVQAIVESSFAFAGQKCSSCSRVITLPGVHESLCGRLKEAVESAIIGPADEPATTVGPVIDDAARQRIHEYVGMGRSEGKLLVQAKLPAACERGFFVAPTIFDGVKPGARIAQEEIFGPVLAILRARDFDDAIDIANGTRYALTGGLFSRSPAHIEQARRDFAVGNLYVNRRITGSQVDAQPFGGFKLSGTGVKAGSPDYLLHFMDARCLTENTLRSGLVPDEEHTEVS
jgi:RHH-type proline utilization regulon transcriptional repressor/proline dehydrogenase/delta 1-pyrroline-5-carboxylate dehydrogenase